MSPRDNQPPEGAYSFKNLEEKWQRHWAEQKTFATAGPGERGFDAARPKYYVLDFFPYPSGSGLHVGHPLGYVATDVFARFKRMRGFNVLHPMGFDAFGLPAEQYAIEHGVHPAETTLANIETFRRQLRQLGLSYDWEREISTCDPGYYKHTQWIFLRLYESWYDESLSWTDDGGRRHVGRARPIAELVRELEAGRIGADEALNLLRNPGQAKHLTWKQLSAAQQRAVLDKRRLAFLAEVAVNWCPALGTVLANEEVTSEGRSERGDHPVFRRPLKQWMLRITAYADRLLSDLEGLDWPEPIKLMQRNWIGRSEGAEVDFAIAPPSPPLLRGGLGGSEGSGTQEQGSGFRVQGSVIGNREQVEWRKNRKVAGFPSVPEDSVIRIYTTRTDTLFGATYMVLAPEHPLVERITTPQQSDSVRRYVEEARHRSDLERTAESKKKTGVFTGAIAVNPVNGEHIPVWVADYVLMGYGTGAIMAVPAGDTRDFEFAKQFGLPIRAVVRPPDDWLIEQFRANAIDDEYCNRFGKLELAERLRSSAVSAVGSVFGVWPEAGLQFGVGQLVVDTSWVHQIALTAYQTDPGIFNEAFTSNGVAIQSGEFDGLPTPDFKKRIVEWLEEQGVGRRSVNTKLRDWIFSRQKYWGEPFPILHGEDGEILPLSESELPLELPPMRDFKPTPSTDPNAEPEPPLGRAKEWVHVERNGRRYRRDLNTMPQWAGSCWYYLRFIDPRNPNRFCDPAAEKYWMPVDLYVGGAEHAVLHLLYARFWHKVLFDLGYVSTPEPFAKLINQGMIQGDTYRDPRGSLIPAEQVEKNPDGTLRDRKSGETVEHTFEKMSKSMKNVVNPDDIIGEYGADAFRMYELFMGPIEASKPWQSRDVPGLYKLLNRVWRMVVNEETGKLSNALIEGEGDPVLLRALHKTIKKVGEDIELFKFNTAIAAMFDFANAAGRCEKRPRAVIETFLLVLAPFAPHMAEELWQRLGHERSLAIEPWPRYEESLVRDPTVEIAVQINGKVRSRVTVPTDADRDRVESAALQDARIAELLRDKTVRKVIVVPGRLVNVIADG